jgi:phosphoglycolate phosphatase
MVEVLEELGADRPLAVATSKPLAYSKPLCDHLGLTPYFAVIEGPSMAEIEPKTDTLRRALDGLELAPGADAPMIGDRLHDVEAAHANGLRCIGVLWGFGTEEELRAAGADAIVTAPEELSAIVL